jgi:hypothetical protein
MLLKIFLVLSVVCLLEAGAQEVDGIEFSDSAGTVDASGELTSVKTHAENHGTTKQNVWVQSGGQRVNLGELEPGESATVVVVPKGKAGAGNREGIYIIDKHH